MTNYFATCGRGLEPILAGELAKLGAQQIKPGRGGVDFVGDASLVYRANLWLRTAVRVLQPVIEADVFNPDELYDLVRSVDWSRRMTPNHTLAVDCNVRDSNITHSQYASRRVKDAICDQFREATGIRPSVNVERPMIGLNLHISKNHAILSLDSSWDSLHKRGYRPIQTRAPLNESLAAGILLHLGYDGSEPLVDPLCGSGTFCIEAASIALRRAPGLTRDWFGFMGWIDFDRSMWAAMTYDARRSAKASLTNPIAGSDSHRGAIDFARDNAKAAGLAQQVRFEVMDVCQARSLAGKPGLLIANPPYGERLGDEQEWIPLYRAIGETVRAHWPGWRLAILTTNDRLAKEVGLNVKRQTPFFNGSLACRLWEFEV